SQVRITWDAKNLYLAVEGVIWGNNTMLLLDTVQGRGLSTLRELNSWKRLFDFTPDFHPDLFVATWDGNSSPKLFLQDSTLHRVTEEESGSGFAGAATFPQTHRRRAMEVAIPWNPLFLGDNPLGPRDTVIHDGRDTLRIFPPGSVLKIAAVVTGGADNTGGPD